MAVAEAVITLISQTACACSYVFSLQSLVSQGCKLPATPEWDIAWDCKLPGLTRDGLGFVKSFSVQAMLCQSH